jgi:hypothetical protein
VPHHDDPVQPGFILHGFARDEMLFRVAQEGSLKKARRKLPLGNLPRMIAEVAACQMPSGAKQKKPELNW